VATENPTILIVDDERMLRHTLCSILTRRGYVVRSAEDGVEALAALHESIPDILLSDLNMPRMSGFELLSLVRAQFPTIYAIAMSGAHAGQAVPPGVMAKAFYEKNAHIEELFKLLENAKGKLIAPPLKANSPSLPKASSPPES
jgi:CheY-like chemotaxis protein